MSISLDTLLVKLNEEAAEVIVAASKCQWMGFDFDPLDIGVSDYGPNDVALAREIGDFLGVLDGLLPFFSIGAMKALREARDGKLAKIEGWEQKRGRKP